MYAQAITFSGGSILSGDTVEMLVDSIIEQLKKLPPENQTEEVITYVLDNCMERVKGKQIIL